MPGTLGTPGAGAGPCTPGGRPDAVAGAVAAGAGVTLPPCAAAAAAAAAALDGFLGFGVLPSSPGTKDFRGRPRRLPGVPVLPVEAGLSCVAARGWP